MQLQQLLEAMIAYMGGDAGGSSTLLRYIPWRS